MCFGLYIERIESITLPYSSAQTKNQNAQLPHFNWTQWGGDQRGFASNVYEKGSEMAEPWSTFVCMKHTWINPWKAWERLWIIGASCWLKCTSRKSDCRSDKPNCRRQKVFIYLIIFSVLRTLGQGLQGRCWLWKSYRSVTPQLWWTCSQCRCYVTDWAAARRMQLMQPRCVYVRCCVVVF